MKTFKGVLLAVVAMCVLSLNTLAFAASLPSQDDKKQQPPKVPAQVDKKEKKEKPPPRDDRNDRDDKEKRDEDKKDKPELSFINRLFST